jgi:hypothetical protein
MQAEFEFDKELHRFITMAIEIWPSFQTGIKHLHEIGHPKEDSFLPQRAYGNMTEPQFTQIVVADLFEFIMTHDIKEEDVEDYLYDILDLLMMDEELIGGSSNPASIQYMARYTHQVIEELQNGRNEKVVKFEEEVYQNVKQFRGQIVEDEHNHDDSEEEDD